MKKKQIVNLAKILGKMKQIKRTGWIRRRVIYPESDAEHSYSLAMLVMLFVPEHLDKLKCLQLALVHDLPEIYCGDILPGEMDPVKKADLESQAMDMIASELEMPNLKELFVEYMQHQTPEAQFVWALDRLDNVFTAKTYENAQHISLVKEFADSARERLYYIHDADLRKKLDAIIAALGKD